LRWALKTYQNLAEQTNIKTITNVTAAPAAAGLEAVSIPAPTGDNLIFSNQTTTVEIGGAASQVATGSSSTYGEAMLGGFLERWTEVGTYPWSPSSVSGTILFAINPLSLFLNQVEVTRKWQNYMKIFGNLEVQFLVNGSNTFFGDVIVAGIPNGTSALVFPHAPDFHGAGHVEHNPGPNMFSVSQCIHGHVDACLSETVVLKLPWIAPIDFLELNQVANVDITNQWVVSGTVISPLGSTTGLTSTPTLSVSVMVRMTDVKLEVPISFEMGKSEGRVASALKTGARLAGTVGGFVPSVAPLAGIATSVLTAAAAVSDFLGFTRESTDGKLVWTRPQLFGTLATADGTDSGATLALLSENAVSRDPAIGGIEGGVDQEAFADFFTHPTLITTIGWTTSQTRGTILQRIQVNPFFGAYVDATHLQLPPVGYAASLFNFWRGPMYYTFRIPCSVQHRGRLQIFYVPNASGSTGVDPTNMSMNVLWDIAPGATKTFRIGWTKPAPYLKVGVPANITNFYTEGYDNGYWALRVINPLTAPDPTASVLIQVYAHSDGNMQLMGPTRPANIYYEMMGTNSADETAHVSEIIELVGDQAKEVDISAIAGGERIESLRTLCQRFFMFERWPSWTAYSPLGAAPINLYTGDYVVERVFFPPPDYRFSPFAMTAYGKKHAYNGGTTVQQGSSFSYLNVFAQCFMGWRGSTRHKLITRANYERFTLTNVPGTAAQIPDPPSPIQIRFHNAGYVTGDCYFLHNPDLQVDGSEDMRSGSLVFDPNQAQGGEFTFPYYAPRSYNVTRFTEVVPLSGSTTTQRQTNPVEDNSMMIQRLYMRTPVGVSNVNNPGINTDVGWDEHWMAAGKDFSLVRFRFVPTVRTP